MSASVHKDDLCVAAYIFFCNFPDKISADVRTTAM